MILILAILLELNPAAYAQSLAFKMSELPDGVTLRCFDAENVSARCEGNGLSEDEISTTSELDISIVRNQKVIQNYGYGRMWDDRFCRKHVKSIRAVMHGLKKDDAVCIAAYVEFGADGNDPPFGLWHSLFTKNGKAER